MLNLLETPIIKLLLILKRLLSVTIKKANRQFHPRGRHINFGLESNCIAHACKHNKQHPFLNEYVFIINRYITSVLLCYKINNITMMQDTVLLNDVHNKYNLSRSFFGLHFIIQFLTRVSSPEVRRRRLQRICLWTSM